MSGDAEAQLEKEDDTNNEELTLLLQQKVWQGRLPTKVSLAANESKSFTNSPPLFIHLPRLLYLPCFLDSIINFFKTELIEAKSDEELYREAWFSFEDAPLKWHWPIGILFDLHTAHDPNSLGDGTLAHPHLPWSLTIHFQDYPKDVLTRRESPQSLQDTWLNNLKETSTIRHGSAKKIFTLATTQIQSLYQSILDLDPMAFHGLHSPLATSPRYIPLRIFLPPPNPPVTPLVAPTLSSTEHQTVGTTLHQVLPALFPSRRTCLFARPVCQGIVVPMSASIVELSNIFCGGDGWTDIVVVMMN